MRNITQSNNSSPHLYHPTSIFEANYSCVQRFDFLSLRILAFTLIIIVEINIIKMIVETKYVCMVWNQKQPNKPYGSIRLLDSPKLNMFGNVTYSNLLSNQLLNQIEGPIQALGTKGKYLYVPAG